jgi:hypothetical protein
VRDYGRVHSAFWSSADMRSLSDDDRLLALYLMSCPHATIAGVFRLPDGYVCEDLQWGSERVSKGFRNLGLKGFANRCETTKWVWICKHLAWNPPENTNQRKGARKVALLVPTHCQWRLEFLRACGPMLGLEAEENETLCKPFRKGFESLATEPEPEPEPDITVSAEVLPEPDKPAKRTRTAKQPVPPCFRPMPETVARLRAEYGLSAADLERCLRVFLDQCAAKGYAYADPNAAFANCVRGDWQGCRTRAAPGPTTDSMFAGAV